MAGEIENEDDTLELGEASDTQEAGGGNDTLAAAEDDDLEVPMFGDPAEDEEDDHPTLKKVRAVLRETQRENAELKRARQPEPEIEVGPEPVWDEEDAGAEWNYSGPAYAAAHREWEKRKEAAEARANAGKEVQKKAQQELAQLVTAYSEKKAALPYADKDEAEATVLATLSPAQQEIIVRVSNDPAKLFYALGRPTGAAKLATLAGMQVVDMGSVAKFAAATAKLDGEVKMAKRRPAAQPERIVQGSASMITASASDLDKAIDKAVAKNDFAEVRRLRKQQRAMEA